MPGNRKEIRLKCYDYSMAGAYHIIICTEKRRNIFRNGTEINEFGRIAENCLKYIEEKYEVHVQKYAIMPDHVHLLIDYFYITKGDGKEQITRIVGAYKSMVYTECLKYCKEKGIVLDKLWQRSFYDHIIRNERDYYETYRYIQNNEIELELQ